MEIAHRRWPLWVLYTLAFAVIAALSFGVFGLANRTLIWNMDGVTQHYPVMLELHRLLAKSGLAGVTGWSWTFGLGADKLTTLAYYVLGDPFAYVLALFPVRLMATGYGVFIVLRLYVTGLAFLALAHRYAFRPGSQLLGAVTYAFTGYSLMIGVHHPFFLLPMIWFPLLLVGIDRILRGHGWQLLGWVTGLAILSNFYFAYILGLGSLIYAVIRFWSLQQQGRLAVKWPIALRRFLFAAISGILVACVLLLPSLLMMLKSTRVGTIFANGLWLYPGSYYLKLPNAILTTGSEPTYWAVFGMSGVTFFGCVYVLRHWRENRPLAATLVLMIGGLLFPAVAAFFNVLSTPSNRWLLLVAVPFGLATMVLGDHLKVLTQRDRYWLVGSAMGLLLVVYACNGFIFSNPERDLVTYGLFLVTTVVILGSAQWPVHTTMALLGVVVGANLVNNAWGYYDPNMGSQATDQLRQGDATRYIQDYFDGAQTAVQHQSTFSRVNTAYNFNLLRTVGNNMTMSHGLNGVMSYFSVQNGYVGQFSRDLQNAQVAMNAPLGQVDNRTAMNNLLGVKTIFAREDQIANHAALPYGYRAGKRVYPEEPVYGLSNGTGTQLLTTMLNFPLVYTQPTTISSAAWHRLSAVDRERSLTQTAVTTTRTNVQRARYQSPKHTVPYTVTADTIPVIDSTNKVIQYRLQQAVTGQQKGLSQKQLENYGSTIKVPKLTVDQNGLISDQAVRQYGPMVALDRNKVALQRVLTTNQRIVKQTTQANQQGLRQLASDAQGNPISYTLTLKRPRQAQGTELYLELDGIQAQRLTTQDKQTAQANTSVLGGTPLSALTQLNTWRSAVLNPDLGDYWLTVKTRNQTKTFSQFGVDNLSDYEPKSHALLNLGYSQQERDTVSVTFNATHQIRFKSAKLIAMPFNKSYDRQVHAVQKRGLQQARVRDNRVTGTLTTTRPSVLTTSIPYSTGWRLKVDGQPVKTQVVNDGFVGAKLAAGQHQIQLTYQTPGLLVGSWLTWLGVIGLLGSAGWARWRKP